MKFALYDALSGGTKKWPTGASEDHVVSAQSGLFSVILGSKEVIPTSVFSDSLFLGIQINDGSGLETCPDGCMVPRQRGKTRFFKSRYEPSSFTVVNPTAL